MRKTTFLFRVGYADSIKTVYITATELYWIVVNVLRTTNCLLVQFSFVRWRQCERTIRLTLSSIR